MKTSNKGISLIIAHEGFSAKPYLCPANKATIGYGNTYYADGTPVMLTDNQITKKEAIELLKMIVRGFEYKVNKSLRKVVNQNQFDALVSHTYNTGGSETLFKLINSDAPKETIRDWFEKRYITANGKVLKGLIKRRKEEADLYFS